MSPQSTPNHSVHGGKSPAKELLVTKLSGGGIVRKLSGGGLIKPASAGGHAGCVLSSLRLHTPPECTHRELDRLRRLKAPAAGCFRSFRSKFSISVRMEATGLVPHVGLLSLSEWRRRQHDADSQHSNRLVQELSAVAHGLTSAAHEVSKRLRPTHRSLPAHVCHDLTGAVLWPTSYHPPHEQGLPSQ